MNKRGSALAVYVYVIFVFLSCILALFYIASHSNKISDNLGKIDVYSLPLQEKEFLEVYLKSIAQDSAVEAYLEVIKNNSDIEKVVSATESSQDLPILNISGKDNFDQRYIAEFSSSFLRYFDGYVNLYSEKNLDTPIKNYSEQLKSLREISFDGDKVSLTFKDFRIGKSKVFTGGDASSKYVFDLKYSFYLEDLGLKNLSQIVNAEEICPDLKSECLQKNYPYFELVPGNFADANGKKITGLLSKKEFFLHDNLLSKAVIYFKSSSN